MMERPMAFKPHVIAWNLTQRCNLRCAHCYLDASHREEGARGELRGAECLRLVDQIAEVGTDLFLILTGGEPLLREDIFDIARYASEQGFTVVIGTNGTLIDPELAGKMADAGIQGAGVSLDSLKPELHDAFRGRRGAWEQAVRGIEALKEVGLEFLIQMTVTQDNCGEVSEIAEFSFKAGAKGFNLFFLVCTGRGEDLTDLDPAQYERTLTDLYPIQRRYEGRMLVRAKCAPHYQRIVYEHDPNAPLLRAYSGACPAGTRYCRISPEGEVTPCPYMPLAVGNLREKRFAEIWRDSKILRNLRDPELKGRCDVCEFRTLCSGCRARAYAHAGDYLGEDPRCAYQPGQYGYERIALGEGETSGPEIPRGMRWTAEAQARQKRIPLFVRRMATARVERFARDRGYDRITPEVMKEARAKLVEEPRGGFPRLPWLKTK